jgi:hypothetical protein
MTGLSHEQIAMVACYCVAAAAMAAAAAVVAYEEDELEEELLLEELDSIKRRLCFTVRRITLFIVDSFI